MKRLFGFVIILLLIASVLNVAIGENWICPSCGRRNSGNFCPDCGTKSPKWRCPSCGIVNYSAYCENCGMKKPTETDEDKTSPLVGDIVIFGNYEQDNNTANGLEPLEWIILEIQEEKIFLLSRYGIETKDYNGKWAEVTWAESPLRVWLNSVFLKSAFAENEQEAIMLTKVDNGYKQCAQKWKTRGGRNTEDKIFLLSYYEAFELYFHDNEERKCAATNYSWEKGTKEWESSVFMVGDEYAVPWWLRSPGSDLRGASVVYINGTLGNFRVNSDNTAVRPALWVSKDAIVNQ